MTIQICALLFSDEEIEENNILVGLLRDLNEILFISSLFVPIFLL